MNEPLAPSLNGNELETNSFLFYFSIISLIILTLLFIFYVRYVKRRDIDTVPDSNGDVEELVECYDGPRASAGADERSSFNEKILNVRYEAMKPIENLNHLFALFLSKPAQKFVKESCLLISFMIDIISTNWSEISSEWSSEDFSHFSSLLITAFKSETNKVIQKKLVKLVAELARRKIDPGTGFQIWSGITRFVMENANSDSIDDKIRALEIISMVPMVLGNDFSSTAQIIDSSFFNREEKIKSFSLKAFVAVCSDAATARTAFLAHLIPSILQKCDSTVDRIDSGSPIWAISTISIRNMSMIQPHVDIIIPLFCKIVLNISESLPIDSPNFMQVLAALSNCPISESQLKDIFTCAVHVAKLQDEGKDEESEINSLPFDISEFHDSSYINSMPFAASLVAILSEFILEDKCTTRVTGLMALTAITKKSAVATESIIDEVCLRISGCLMNTDPKVRLHACSSIRWMVLNSTQSILNKIYGMAASSLLLLIDDSSVKVRAQAVATLSGLIESCSKATITANFDSLLHVFNDNIEKSLNKEQSDKTNTVDNQLLCLLSSLISVAPHLVATHYLSLIGPLKRLLNERYTMSKSLIAISLLGHAVGKEKFKEDLNEIMCAITSNMDNILSTLPRDEIGHALGRIMGVIGEEAIRFLPDLLPPLLNVIRKTDVTIHSGGFKSIVQCGVLLTRKTNATKILVNICRELGGIFTPYLNTVSQMALDHLKNPEYSSKYRNWAMEIAPHLIECAKLQGGIEAMRDMWKRYWSAIQQMAEYDRSELERIRILYESDSCLLGGNKNGDLTCIKSVYNCMMILGSQGLTMKENDMKEIEGFAKEQKIICETNIKKRAAQNTEDDDSEEREPKNDERAKILGQKILEVINDIQMYLSATSTQ